MLNKPPEYIPDYHALWRNLTLSLRDWQDTYEWVCRAEGTKMEIDIKYGESYFDKRGEELIKGSKEFKITSTSSDGEIESIKHIYLPWEAWMWHPERNKNYNLKDIKRVKNLFNC